MTIFIDFFQCEKFCRSFHQLIHNGNKIPRFQADDSDYLMESQFHGWSTVETWKTKEDKTGFMVGWEGCMAEDSHSFAKAFQVKLSIFD